MDEKTKALVEAAEKRAETATPGPWHDDNGYRVRNGNGDVVTENKHCEGSVGEDAAFIAAARSDVPALCAAVRAMDDELVSLRETLRAIVEDWKGLASTSSTVNSQGYRDGVRTCAKVLEAVLRNKPTSP